MKEQFLKDEYCTRIFNRNIFHSSKKCPYVAHIIKSCHRVSEPYYRITSIRITGAMNAR